MKTREMEWLRIFCSVLCTHQPATILNYRNDQRVSFFYSPNINYQTIYQIPISFENQLYPIGSHQVEISDVSNYLVTLQNFNGKSYVGFRILYWYHLSKMWHISNPLDIKRNRTAMIFYGGFCDKNDRLRNINLHV